MKTHVLRYKSYLSQFNGQELTITSRGRGIKPKDVIRDGNSHYQVIDISYYSSPSDVFQALVTRVKPKVNR